MFRIFIFIVIALLMLTPFFWLAGIISVWYMFRFTGFELIVLAILIDGYFGAFYNIPIISISTIIMVFSIDLLKPTLLMYTSKDEMV